MPKITEKFLWPQFLVKNPLLFYTLFIFLIFFLITFQKKKWVFDQNPRRASVYAGFRWPKLFSKLTRKWAKWPKNGQNCGHNFLKFIFVATKTVIFGQKYQILVTFKTPKWPKNH